MFDTRSALPTPAETWREDIDRFMIYSLTYPSFLPTDVSLLHGIVDLW